MNTLEKYALRIGIMPLADAAPIIIAQNKGYFARQGLEVEISAERAWAAVRDKLVADRLDAAQLLAPLPLAASLGLDAVHVPMQTGLVLSRNGNSIVVSPALHRRLQELLRPEDGGGALAWARALRRLTQEDRAAGRPPLVFAHVYPFSTHHYELRYWLSAGGVHPDHDLNLVVVPPPQAVAQLHSGRIDGFCVGAPWGEVAESTGVGRRIVSKYQIWNNGPEKVLGVTQAWAEQHPQTHLALLTALIEANRWLDLPEHRSEASAILEASGYLDVSAACIAASLAARPVDAEFGPGPVFHAGAAGFPWRSQARWFLVQMRRWPGLPPTFDDATLRALAAQVYRPELYRAAAARLGIAAPREDYKTEGAHGEAWILDGEGGPLPMAADRFLDGAILPE